jgi:hypothetical protein
MHGATVVAKDEAGVGQPVSQVESTRLAREVGDGGTEGFRNRLAGFYISWTAEQNRFEGMGFLKIADDGSERGGIPAFGRSVSGSGKNGEVRLGWSIFGPGQHGRLGQFGFGFRQSEVFQKTEILVGHMDVSVR